MTYYLDKTSNETIDESRRFPVIRADVELGFDTVQLYQAGALVAHASPVDGSVTFAGALPGYIDPFFLLAVDGEDANTNFWDEAFPEAEANGNRIKVEYPTTVDTQLGWRWRVSIDGVQQYEAYIFPNSQGAGGYGIAYGVSYGVGPFGAGYGSSYGTNYGHGGGIVLEWVSEPLFNGTYSVTVNVIDQAGNVSTPDTESVTIETYARPASNLVIESYVQATDTLTLSWTESEDI